MIAFQNSTLQDSNGTKEKNNILLHSTLLKSLKYLQHSKSRGSSLRIFSPFRTALSPSPTWQCGKPIKYNYQVLIRRKLNTPQTKHRRKSTTTLEVEEDAEPEVYSAHKHNHHYIVIGGPLVRTLSALSFSLSRYTANKLAE